MITLNQQTENKLQKIAAQTSQTVQQLIIVYSKNFNTIIVI